MQNLLSLWSALDLRRRAVVVVATASMFLAVLGLSRMAAAPEMALLYAGLDPAAAGQVVTALEQRGVAYKISGAAIHVPENQRDELRMTLAAEGMPAAGSAGYELLDGLSGFGTTSQMFDAAYWRAKEGELARTILALPQVRAARVHISHAEAQPFRRDQAPTASVTVTTAGGTLPPAQAKALKYLVASAVAGMTPAAVAVIDSVGGLIAAGDETPPPGLAGDVRAAELKQNVERLLAARVGPGKAVVEVSVDIVTDSESILETRFDPQGRVAISTDSSETSTSATEPEGQVTVASNLPEGDAAAGGSGRSQSAETRERVNFEVSETRREVLRGPGAIRKLSVAVLVDGLQSTGPDGAPLFEPRPEAELAILRELVESAVGSDAARGDVITLRSLAFEPPAEAGTLAEAGMLAGLDVMTAVQVAVLALVALVLGLFVLRPVLLSPARERPGLPPLPAPLALPGSAAGDRVLTGEIDEGDLPPLSLVSDGTAADGNDPVARLRRLIAERQAESVEILRSWMEDREERT